MIRPFTELFGNNIMAIRLPAVVTWLASCALAWLLARRIYRSHLDIADQVWVVTDFQPGSATRRIVSDLMQIQCKSSGDTHIRFPMSAAEGASSVSSRATRPHSASCTTPNAQMDS